MTDQFLWFQVQQELEYTLLKPDCHCWWISKMQSGREDILEEWYAVRFYFNLGKNATETYGMLLDHLEWIEHRFLSGIRGSRKAGSLWGMMRCVERVIHQSWFAKGLGLGLGYYVEVLREFRKRFHQKRPALFKSAQWHFSQDNAPVHNSILVTDYLTKVGIKTVPPPTYSPDLVPCDFCLFPKLRGCRYETIEEMKEALTKVIDTLTQEDFHGAFQKLLERYNKCNAAGGDYFEGDYSFICVLSIKVPIQKSLETYLTILVLCKNTPSKNINCVVFICYSKKYIQRKRLIVKFLRTKKICKRKKKNEKRRTRTCSTKQLGLLNTGKAMRLLIRKRTVLTLCTAIKCTSAFAMVRFKACLYSPSRVSVLPIPINPTMHYQHETTPFLSLKGNNFDIFFVGSDSEHLFH